MVERFDRFWVGVAAALLVVSLCGALVFVLVLQRDSTPIALREDIPPVSTGSVAVTGAVNNPGIYPLFEGDSVRSLVAAAGGASQAPSSIRLTVFPDGMEALPQKVDLNRADRWLLEALPGIGPSTAQAIIDRRNSSGPYRMVEDLLQIRGVGNATFQRIQPYVTVGD